MAIVLADISNLNISADNVMNKTILEKILGKLLVKHVFLKKKMLCAIRVALQLAVLVFPVSVNPHNNFEAKLVNRART